MFYTLTLFFFKLNLNWYWHILCRKNIYIKPTNDKSKILKALENTHTNMLNAWRRKTPKLLWSLCLCLICIQDTEKILAKIYERSILLFFLGNTLTFLLQARHSNAIMQLIFVKACRFVGKEKNDKDICTLPELLLKTKKKRFTFFPSDFSTCFPRFNNLQVYKANAYIIREVFIEKNSGHEKQSYFSFDFHLYPLSFM